MSSPRLLRARLPGLAAVLLLGSCALAAAAPSPAAHGQLPADCSAYASIPLPAEAEHIPVPSTSPACASYRSYRGIGRPVNYSEARACAWQERLAQKADLGQNQKEPTASVVGGSLILADIYFNGAGVKRNIPLAMRFACESEEGMAILRCRTSRNSTVRLPLTDLSNSATMPCQPCTMNFCSWYESEIDDDRRSRYYDSLKSSMTPGSRKLSRSSLPRRTHTSRHMPSKCTKAAPSAVCEPWAPRASSRISFIPR